MELGRFTSSYISRWIDALVAADTYLSLVNADPFTVSDPLTVELSGGGYVRQQLSGAEWTRVDPTLIVNTDSVVWHVPVGATIAGVAAFEVAVNGTMVFADLLDTPVTMPLGGAWVLPAGELFVGVDVDTGP